MSELLTPHPRRDELNDEVHARPPAPIRAPARLSSLTLFFDRNNSGQLEAIIRLARRMGAPEPDTRRAYYTGIIDKLMIRWSLHTEFVRYTFIEPAEDEPDFTRTALDRIPPDWLQSVPGQLLVALHAVLLRDAPTDNSAPAISARLFSGNELIGGEIAGGLGCAFTDLRLHPDPRASSGFSRFVLIDKGMEPLQTGRMLQRMFEIETYRMLALLSLPEAKQQMPRLDALSNALRSITARMDQPEHDASELLHELAAQAGALENLVAQSQYRLSASSAYYNLVERRIAELREQRFPGLQPFQEFMEHRLAPAMETCDTVVARQDRIAARIQRTSTLLRTRVEVQHEEQNRALLASMDTRAALQLRLQLTVEGLSVGVLTYYAVGLVAYAAKALKAAGWHLEPEIVTGWAIPIAAISVWAGVRLARRHLYHT